MNSTSSSPQKTQKAVPQRRGQIKAQIFASVAEKLSSAASKAGEAISNLIKSGNDGVRSPASTTPPPSDYTSDGSSGQA